MRGWHIEFGNSITQMLGTNSWPGGTPRVHEQLNDMDQSNVLSSFTHGDPETPVFSAKAGTPVRFRVIQPTGHPRQQGFTIFGHN